MTPEAHTPDSANQTVHHDSAQRPELILIPREETAYKVTHTLEMQGCLHGGTPLPKRQKVEEAVTVQ